MKHVLNGFRQFVLRGNVVDLAVGVIIGASFGAVVTALVVDIITPLIGVIAKVPDFAELSFTLNGSVFAIGDFINKVVSFLLVASSVYFIIIVPLNLLAARQRREQEEKLPKTRLCPECLNEIPVAAKRCGYCTSILTQA